MIFDVSVHVQCNMAMIFDVSVRAGMHKILFQRATGGKIADTSESDPRMPYAYGDSPYAYGEIRLD